MKKQTQEQEHIGVGLCKKSGCSGEVDKTVVENPITKIKLYLEEPGYMTCQTCGALHFFHFTYALATEQMIQNNNFYKKMETEK